jgi:non-specific protein-tyrosine kinase
VRIAIHAALLCARHPHLNAGAAVKPERFLKLVRRWMPMVVLCGGLGAGAAYGTSHLMTKTYEADGSVVVNAAPGGPSNSLSLTANQVTSTYAALMSGRDLLQQVIRDVHLSDTVETLRPRISAIAERDTELIDVKVTDANASIAAKVANTLMRDFTAKVSAENQQRIAAAGATLSDQIDQLSTSLSSENTQLVAAQASHQDTTSIRQQIQANSALLAQLTNNYSSFQAQQAQNLNSVNIASSAVAPPSPASPRVLLNTVLGLIGGLVAAVGVVALLEYLDQRLRTADDVRERLNIATLAVIPRFRKDRGKAEGRNTDVAGEAYRRLRTNFMFAAVERPFNSIVVASVRSGEGKSRTAANLAGVIAAAGQKVILVDADMRRPTQHILFGQRSGRGLSEFLLSLRRRDSHQVEGVVTTDFPGLSLLTAGTIPPNPGELLAGRHAAALVRALELEFETVVIDTPPVSLVADSLSVAAAASATILVVEAGRTNAREALRAIEALRGVGANVIGAVLNKSDTRHGGDYYGYRSKGYGYLPEDGDTSDGTERRAWSPIGELTAPAAQRNGSRAIGAAAASERQTTTAADVY